MNADCARCRAILPFYAAAPDSAEDRAFVVAHLATCVDCQRELAAWRAITAAMRQPRIGDTPTPVSLARALAAIGPQLTVAALPKGATNMQEHSANQAIAAHLPPARHRFAAWSAIMATIALIVIAAFIFNLMAAPKKMSRPPPFGFGLPTTIDFRSVSFGSPTDGWAVGSTTPPGQNLPGPAPYVTPVLAHYSAHHWQMVAPPAALANRSIVLASVAMTSATNGWAVGYTDYGPTGDGPIYGIILRYTGGQWLVAQDQVPSRLRHIFMRTATDGWIVGDSDSQLGAPKNLLYPGWVAHYDGTTWQRQDDTTFEDVNFTSVAALTADEVWLVGTDYSASSSFDGNAPDVVIHHTAQGWVRQTIPHAYLEDVVAAAPDAAWVVGEVPGGTGASGSANLSQPGKAAVYRVSPTTTTVAQQFTSPDRAYSYVLTSLSQAGPQDLWAVGSEGLIVHSQGGQWRVTQQITRQNLLAVTMLSATDGWAVGQHGAILWYINGAWHVVNGG